MKVCCINSLPSCHKLTHVTRNNRRRVQAYAVWADGKMESDKLLFHQKVKFPSNYLFVHELFNECSSQLKMTTKYFFFVLCSVLELRCASKTASLLQQFKTSKSNIDKSTLIDKRMLPSYYALFYPSLVSCI